MLIEGIKMMNPLYINITKADVGDYLNKVASMLDNNLDESKFLIPSIFVYCRDSINKMTLIFSINADMKNAKKRNEVFKYIGKNIADDRRLPLITCFVTTALMFQEKHHLPPFKNQNRKEALVIFALSLNCISLVSHAEINEKRIDSFCEVSDCAVYPLNQIYHGYLDKLDEMSDNVLCNASKQEIKIQWGWNRPKT
jgi:hypothetical protein